MSGHARRNDLTLPLLAAFAIAVLAIAALLAPPPVGKTANAAPASSVADLVPPKAIAASVLLSRLPKTAPAVAPKAKPKPVVVKPKPKEKSTSKVIRTHRANLDRGILPSAYKGPYYDARFESFRRCVVKRESEGRYGALNHGSGAAGAYQFMPSWTATIQKWTGERVPIYAMSRYAQDLAFWRAFNHGRGASNWAGGRWYCGL